MDGGSKDVEKIIDGERHGARASERTRRDRARENGWRDKREGMDGEISEKKKGVREADVI